MGSAAERNLEKEEFRELEKAAPPLPWWRTTELEILGELDSDLGQALWHSMRSLRDWAGATEAARVSLFRPVPSAATVQLRRHARAEAPELAEALDALAAVTAAPLTVDPRELARACARVAEWAEARGRQKTSVLFAEAAAQLDPDEPNWARIAGRACRMAAEWHRSETWYLRAILHAREQKKLVSYIRAYLGYGTLALDQGDVERARRLFQKVGNLARQEGKRALAAQAWHDLMLMCAMHGYHAKAQKYATRALGTYPVHHARIPAFAHDFGFWLVRRRLYAAARQVLSGVPSLVTNLQDLTLVWSTVAWAAAGTGQNDEFRHARHRVIELSAEFGSNAPIAFLHLAAAAHVRGEREEASRLVVKSVELSRERGDGNAAEEGLAWLAELDQAERLSPSVPRGDGMDDELQWLVDRVVRLIARWRGPTWKRRRPAGPEEVGKI